MDREWIEKLKRELAKPLPGIEAQLRLSPPDRRNFAAITDTYKKSAVLIVLYWQNNQVHTVFIKRAEYDGIHSGQVSLPGGMYEDIDGDLQNTALRETFEETGLLPENVSVIGTMTSLHIPISNFLVFPYVGFCAERPVFSPDPVEVSYLIETSILELMNPENRKYKVMVVGDREIEIPYFDIQGNHIWGATAMIMSEFLEIVNPIIPRQ
jgi:8-oxo-dGTP pyrophosphatase MutT (NUDIX family)